MEENVYLLLGCYGRKEDTFTLCPSCKNRILTLDDSLLHVDEMWSYFEGVGLLDKPLIDINAVRNFAYKMQDRFDQSYRKLWSERDFHLIERFMHMHKACGLYVKLEVGGEEQHNNEFELVKVEGAKTPQNIAEPNVIHLSRRR